MGARSLDRRRFLKASAALAVAAGMAERPSRGGELGVDAGPFATDNEVIREARRAALAILKPREGELRRGLELHADAVVPGERVLIVDDVLATGGTARAACNLVERAGAKVAGLAFAIELSFLNGKSQIDGYDYTSLLVY